MRCGGGSPSAQGLKAHSMIGLMVTAEQGEQSCMFNFVPDGGFCTPEFILTIAKHRTLTVSLEYTLCTPPKLADQ